MRLRERDEDEINGLGLCIVAFGLWTAADDYRSGHYQGAGIMAFLALAGLFASVPWSRLARWLGYDDP